MSPGPLRIALLTHSTNPRGGVVHALELAEALREDGHLPVVHAPDPQGRGFFRATRCPVVSVPARPAPGGLLALVRQRIDEYLRYFEDPAALRFDIFHAQDGISANALATLAARGAIRGFLRTVHHLDEFDDRLLSAYQRRSVVAARQTLCVSRKWEEILRRDWGVSAAVVPNGVDPKRFSAAAGDGDEGLRRRLGLGPGPVFLAVGGVEARKNTFRILEAFLRVRRIAPAAQLVVAGGASLLDHEAYRAAFAARVREAGIATGPGTALVFAGVLTDAEMPALFRLASALVFASVQEGFGLAVLEALASGVPAVVSRIAPFTEYLTSRECVWADPLDPPSIAAAMARAVDPAIAGPLREAGLGVSRRHTWASSARRHAELYRRFLGHTEREETRA